MAPYDNLPHFRRWLEKRIGHTSKSRNDMLILGDYVRYKLAESPDGSITNFHIKYRNREWFVGLSLAPNTIPASANEMVIELTDDAISSVIAQCAFNEGSVLKEREQGRQGKT